MVLLYIILIVIYIYSIIISLKRKSLFTYIFLSFYSLTILNILGLESGKFILFLTILIIGSIYIIIKNKHILSINNLKSNYFIYVLLFLIVVSYLISRAIDSPYAISKFISTGITIIFPSVLFLFVSKYDSFDTVHIIRTVISTSSIVALMIIYKVFIGGAFNTDGNFMIRVTIGLMNEIWLARLLSLSMLFILSKEYTVNKIIKVSLIILTIFALFFTGSKIFIYFLPIVLLIYIYHNYNYKKILSIGILFILLSFVIYNIVTDIFDINSILLRYGFQSNTISIRLGLFKTSINSYLNGNFISYLFGNGYGTVPESLLLPNERIYPHNIIIEILYELGIIGVLLLITSILITILQSKKDNIYIYAMILFLLFSLSSGDVSGNNFLFLFIIIASIRKQNTYTSVRN